MRCIYVVVYIVFILEINYRFSYLLRLSHIKGTAFYHQATVPKMFYLTLYIDC